jgi:uncharacterized protein YjbI with pentapeptide repeats
MEESNLVDCWLEKAKVRISPNNLPPYLRRVFTEHEQWVLTGGKKGQRGTLNEENLGYLDLSKRDLSGIVLKRCNLDGADLSRCSLLFANLTKAILTNANLTGAALSGASLAGADLSHADLSGALLTPISVRSVDGNETGRVRMTDLRHAKLKDAVLDGLDLTQCVTAS